MKQVTENNYCTTQYIGESLGQIPFLSKDYAMVKLDALLNKELALKNYSKIEGNIFTSLDKKIVTEFSLVYLQFVR